MQKLILKLSVAGLILMSFSEAAQAGTCNRQGRDEQIAGAIIGGILGGVIGHQIGGGRGNDVATVVGALGGAMIGGEIGCQMGNEEYYEINRVRTSTFDSGYGAPYSWRTSRFQGNIVYTRQGYSVYQNVRIMCRDYQSVVSYGGHQEVTNGTVCRYPDGSVRDVQNTQVYYEQYTYPFPRPPMNRYPYPYVR